MINHVFELFDFNEALTPYGTIDTRSPSQSIIVMNNFNSGTDFRTGIDVSGKLQLELEDRILTLIIDESGSMTWNDNSNDRYTYYKRLLTKLSSTYPGSIKANLIGFGGIPTSTDLFVADAGINTLSDQQKNFGTFLQEVFQDSVFDFAGVRVVRRSDRFPNHPADGVIVAEGILKAVKDDNLVEGQPYYYGIWTFNKDLHFSRGQFISAVPFDRILPSGVNFASALPRILPGVERDNNTIIIYNFATKGGRIIFDSSGSGRHGTVNPETVLDNFWLGDRAGLSHNSNNEGLKHPVGVRFDGEFDIIETDINDITLFSQSNAQKLTISLWVFRYTSTTDVWLIGTSTKTPSNDVGWVIGLNNNGQVAFGAGDISLGLTSLALSDIVPERQWTMITVKISLVGSSTLFDFFINAVSQGVVNIAGSVPSINTLYIGAKPEDSGSSWSGTDFFGSLAHISIHDIARDTSYIANLFTKESIIFDQSESDFSQNPPDNRQRETLLSWEIGEDFDFQNGNIKILRKYLSVPSHDNDGYVVLSRNAESGQFFFLDTFDFTNNSDYYYRIFTYNSIGNACDRLDARILPVHIPSSNNELDKSVLSPVSNETVLQGNKKVFLEWSNPTDSTWKGTRVYFGEDDFPTIDDDGKTNATVLIDTTNNFVVHRTLGKTKNGTDIPLINGSKYYYTLVTYDKFNRLSEARFLIGLPSAQFSNVFLPEEVSDLHIDLINPKTLSVQWNNPVVRTEELELFFGDSAFIFVSVRDIFGGALADISNLKIEVCTTIVDRGLETTEKDINDQNSDSADKWGPDLGFGISIDGRRPSAKFEDNCNDEREERETVLSFTTVSSGLIKGLLTHTSDRDILSRRLKYTMDIRAQYQVTDPDVVDGDSLFEFNTLHSRVIFRHPIEISAINKLQKFATLGGSEDGGLRGQQVCECPDTTPVPSAPITKVNGGYINATLPYVCRVELQYKDEALPDGTPVIVSLFKHGDKNNPNPLSEKSDRTFIREGSYPTSSIIEEDLDENGETTGRLVSKSIIDIEVVHPSLPDHVDIYITLDYLGFFVDAVHTLRFISTLFLTTNISHPPADGIATSEQFATVYTLHPDFPDDLDRRLPAPDGTLVKWELLKLENGKERSFYSTEIFSELLAGVYSSTVSGVARKVFFGPVGNVTNHFKDVNCDDSFFRCCVGEEYAIKASVILAEESATDGEIFNYPCEAEVFSGRRLLMNAAHVSDQALADITQEPPHWIVWADGDHMVKFQIARDAGDATDNEVRGASCFRDCLRNINGSTLPLSDEKIVQIFSPGEVLWNVVFDIDPYTGQQTVVSFDSRPASADGDTILPANIPISGRVTDFYVRWNKFVNQDNPRPIDPEQGEFGDGTGGGLLPWEWRNICVDTGSCSPVEGIQWLNVTAIEGSTTVIVNNKESTLVGGGDYSKGMPPIYIGFQEPLQLILDFPRANGEREIDGIIMDGVSYHTFVVEVLFAGNPVPDGTPVEITIEGDGRDHVILSDCASNQNEATPTHCSPSSSGTVFTQQINDVFLNPQNDAGTVPKKSIAFFTIEPLHDTISFKAMINVTCRYDKLTSLGLDNVEREIVEVIEISNTVSPPAAISPIEDGEATDNPTSNESIVYDTIQDLYETTRAGMVQRIGHFASSVTHGTVDSIYVFGGLSTNSQITALSEIFDTSSQDWVFTTDMFTPRAFGMTVEKDGVIYTIGGIEKNELNQLIVSFRIESFSTSSNSWNHTLTPMRDPDNNNTLHPIAYGDAQVVGDYIYVTCGITSLINNSQPGDLNEKILRYSIVDDEWKVISPSNVDLYKRITPFGFYRDNPLVIGDIPSERQYYIYGGSIPKSPDELQNEREKKIQFLLNEFRSSILGSSFYLNLTESKQEEFITQKEQEISDGVVIPAFSYPATGFRFVPGSEGIEYDGSSIDISDTLDQYWRILPMPRDHGRCVYVSHQDIAYFMGGSNQNQSTTLNRVESINLANNNEYTRLTPFNRGRAMFGAVFSGDDIFLSGGLTSGHKEGYVQIEIEQFPDKIEARGTQSSGMIITLTNDSGEIIDADIRVDVRGILRVDELDNATKKFLSDRGADRALGGDGSGNAADLPGFEDIGEGIDVEKLIRAQSKLIDPNSDEFQFSSARKLGEKIFLFPILYSQNEFTIKNGIGGVILEPRSEDPLSELKKLSEFIESSIASTPDDDETFEGDLTREELSALGDALSVVKLPPTIIDSGALRELYKVETLVTILDTFYFGQTVSDFDLDVQELIKSRIVELLTPPEEDPASAGTGSSSGNSTGEIGGTASSGSTVPLDTNPADIGDFSQSGQCEWCLTVLPRNASEKPQKPTVETLFYNIIDWMPQIKKRIVTNTTSLTDVLEELDIIDHEVPFGGSQLYNAIVEASRVTSGEDLNLAKKAIYVASDNSQNLSLISRNKAIASVNSIDGERNVPVIYILFSTSFPQSIAAELQRSDEGDIEKISQETGGQSITLVDSGFLDQILNLSLGSATGGLGYGIHTQVIEFNELSAITSMVIDFNLPSNTQGMIRFRYSQDGFNFTDFGEKYEGSQLVNFVDFFAKMIEVEVILSTGFTEDITEEYDIISTGIPKLCSITWNTSGDRLDYMFVNNENVLTNTQQVAASFEGTLPENAVVDIGVASSISHDWRDFQSLARPALREYGKTFLLDRSKDPFSLVSREPLVSIDGLRYTSNYGSWDPESQVQIFEVQQITTTSSVDNGVLLGSTTTTEEVPVLTGFVLYPRKGEIYFDTRQSPNKVFSMTITNQNKLRVGLRLSNRLHSDSISIHGVGFIYSTNNEKPTELSQVAPSALNVRISPQSPNARDTFFALYDYLDLNQDTEDGTIISWFRNGSQLLEIQNKSSWSKSDLLLENQLQSGDKITFSVAPSDGKDFGTIIFSPAVTIMPTEPGLDNLRIVPSINGITSARYDTSSRLTVVYTFITEDEGIGSVEDGTIIKWFVNGSLFKEGTFSDLNPDPYNDAKIIIAGEVGNGILAHTINNEISVEVTPKTQTITGAALSSSTIIIENTIPTVAAISLVPELPTTQSTLSLSYTLSDADIDNDTLGQSDQSEIKWFNSPNGVDFAEVTQLAGLLLVERTFLKLGEHWYATVTPFDGLEVGPLKQSPTRIISGV